MVSAPPKSLIENLKRTRCVLFAGSGLSSWAHLPTWTELLNAMVQELDEDLREECGDELDVLVTQGKLLEVADYCKEKLGRAKYYGVLADRLRIVDGQVPEPHKVIVDLPFSAVVTTNFDKLLEQSYIRVKKSWPSCPTHTEAEALGTLLYNNNFFVLKAHGDIDSPRSLILTAPDYQEIIHSNPAFNAVFSAIMLTKSLFFVGYSQNDPDFRLLLDWQFATFKGTVPERYALMTGVSSIERDVLWRTANIKVIAYDDHNEVLEFLRKLRQDYLGNALSATA
jgi:hypothetical protein